MLCRDSWQLGLYMQCITVRVLGAGHYNLPGIVLDRMILKIYWHHNFLSILPVP